ncbi:MAG: hypothetical protein E6929_01080 [Clostridium sp.]|nr:hypothetical protein [Clostridium sp.]
MIILLFIFILGSNKVDENNKNLIQGERALNDKKYEMALSYFQNSIKDGNCDKDVIKLESIVKKYIEAKEKYKCGKIEDAWRTINDIDNAYLRLGLQQDVETLKKEITRSIDEKEKEKYKNSSIIQEQIIFDESSKADYVKYKNEKYSFYIDLPKGLTIITPLNNNDGLIASSEDGKIVVMVWGMFNTQNLSNEYIFAQELVKVPIVNYKFIGDKSNVVSWIEDDDIYYKMQIVSNSEICSFLIQYPLDNKIEMDNVVTSVADSFMLDEGSN